MFIYELEGASKIERYCKECLEKEGKGKGKGKGYNLTYEPS